MIVTAAALEDKPRVLALVQLYVYDLSSLFGIDVGDDGTYKTPPLDLYWTDPGCQAFLVRADDKLAGFALVRDRSRLTGDAVHDMAEFFILKKLRRHNIGGRAAAALFDRFPGPWEVRQRAENSAATEFWRRTIGRYTGGRFEEESLDDDRWRGPVQRFTSASPT